MQKRLRKNSHKKIGQSKYKKVYKITKHFINMWIVIPCAFAEYYLVLRILLEENKREVIKFTVANEIPKL